MKKLVRLIIAVVTATALFGVVSATEPLTPTAAAASTSSKQKSSKASKQKVKLPKRCKTKGVVLCASKKHRKLYYVRKGKIIKTMDARFGCAGSLRTREGTFRVKRKSRYHVSTIYHTSMPYAMFFSGGQAVHYSPDFAARGYNGCSHGCVNIRDRTKVAWVYKHTKVGTKVVVYR